MLIRSFLFSLLGLGLIAQAPAAAMGGAESDEPEFAPAALGKVVTTSRLEWDANLVSHDFAYRNTLKQAMVPIDLVTEKPAAITMAPPLEPGAKRWYGSITLGDGPLRKKLLILDESPNQDVLYINDDCSGDFRYDKGYFFRAIEQKIPDGRVFVGLDVSTVLATASWKSAKGAPTKARLGLTLWKTRDSNRMFYRLEGAPTGTITLGGKKLRVALPEYNGTGVMTPDFGLPKGQRAATPLFLIDKDSDGSFAGARVLNSEEQYYLGQAFDVAGKWYGAQITPDGTTLTVREAAVPESAKVKTRPTVAVGEIAPDFEMIHPDGTRSRLSDRRGKVVLVDFWATWCGPCQSFMPGVEAMHRRLKGQPGVEIIGLCVGDKKSAFDKWIEEKKGVYTFTFGFDPAGKSRGNDAIMTQYGVMGIPTTFLIDREGKVAAVSNSAAEENHEMLARAMKALGVKFE